MTHNIHHSEEHRVRSYSMLRLSERSLSLAIGIATALVYIFCTFFIVFAPRAAMTLFSYTLHADLTNIVLNVGWGSFITGLFAWSLGTGLYAAFVARLYNRLV